MLRSAEYFAELGELTAYCSPATLHADELRTLGERLPAAVAGPVVAQLSLRSAPAAVPRDRIVRASTAPEVLSVLSKRMGAPESVFLQLAHLRSAVCDRSIAARLHRDAGAVIGYQGAAAEMFEAARRRGLPCVLDYPVAHFEHTDRICNEELKLVPAYAATMQGHNYAAWRLRRYRREIESADRIIMVSTYHQRTFEEAGVDPERMFMAHFGVDTQMFTPGTPREDGPFRVLFCGQISQRKGISYLIDGFRKAELGDAELVFAGRPVGTTSPWIEEPRVRWVGALPRPALVDVYRSADVIVLPSLIEGFPATPIEGMACGLPAIVSEHTFGHDVIEDGVDGWVTPIRDSDSIARHLRALYEDRELLSRMKVAARRKAEQFTWDRYGAALRDGIAPLFKTG